MDIDNEAESTKTIIEFRDYFDNVNFPTTFKTFNQARFVSEADEGFLLNGLYTLRFCLQINQPEYYDFDSYWNNVEPFQCGYILYNVNEPDFVKKINVLIDSTYCKTKPLEYTEELDNKNFTYDHCIFQLYGAYVYGYDHLFTKFQSVGHDEKNLKFVENDVDDEGTLIFDYGTYPEPPVLSDDLITIPAHNSNKHNNAFSIINQHNVLVAFGLY